MQSSSSHGRAPDCPVCGEEFCDAREHTRNLGPICADLSVHLHNGLVRGEYRKREGGGTWKLRNHRVGPVQASVMVDKRQSRILPPSSKKGRFMLGGESIGPWSSQGSVQLGPERELLGPMRLRIDAEPDPEGTVLKIGPTFLWRFQCALSQSSSC